MQHSVGYKIRQTFSTYTATTSFVNFGGGNLVWTFKLFTVFLSIESAV